MPARRPAPRFDAVDALLQMRTPAPAVGQGSTFHLPQLGAVPMQGGSSSFASAGGGGTGWQSSLTPAERELWQHESSLNPLADNPSSTAFGIWQGLASTRAQYAKRFGYDPNTTDPMQQLQMGRAYVADRYGNADNAWRFWQQHHWY